jgi:uncharacterized protein YndB with AHSA1/START domain
MDLGSFVRHEGRPAVRFEREYPYPVERVWRAITDADEVSGWFPSSFEFEPWVGGRIRFSGDPNMPDAEGTILAYTPPHAFACTWGTDELHFTLRSRSAGACVLVLVNVLASENTAARNATGWTVCLGELTKVLAGQPGSGPHGADVPPFQPLYDTYVAGGMPHGAAIPGID